MTKIMIKPMPVYVIYTMLKMKAFRLLGDLCVPLLKMDHLIEKNSAHLAENSMI